MQLLVDFICQFFMIHSILCYRFLIKRKGSCNTRPMGFGKVSGYSPDILLINQDLAHDQIHKAHEEIDNRGFTRTSMPTKRWLVRFLDLKGDIFLGHPVSAIIRKIHGQSEYLPLDFFSYQLLWAHSRLDPSSQRHDLQKWLRSVRCKIWVTSIKGWKAANILAKGIDKTGCKARVGHSRGRKKG